MKYLIVGLGNIGAEYDGTRHNIGFDVLDFMAEKKGVAFKTEKLASMALIKHKGRQIYMAKPSTYMNLSGKAVRYWMQQLKVEIENTLIIVDDLALPLGTLRMRGKGSDAGHNGLKDIQDKLGTNKYPRLRFGIGSDFPKGKQIDFVLGKFEEEEQKQLPDLLKRSREMCLGFCTVGIARTMSQFNN